MQKCELSRICFILYLPRLPKLNEIYCGIAQNSFEEKLAFAPQIHNFFKCLWDVWSGLNRLEYYTYTVLQCNFPAYFCYVLQSCKLLEGIQLIHVLEIPKHSSKCLAKNSVTNEAVMKRALNVEAKGSLLSSDNNNLVAMEDKLLD